jgi:hypothetical protein
LTAGNAQDLAEINLAFEQPRCFADMKNRAGDEKEAGNLIYEFRRPSAPRSEFGTS